MGERYLLFGEHVDEFSLALVTPLATEDGADAPAESRRTRRHRGHASRAGRRRRGGSSRENLGNHPVVLERGVPQRAAKGDRAVRAAGEAEAGVGEVETVAEVGSKQWAIGAGNV